ncbi:MAG TPA: alpha/beta hydrolase [Actinomycetales bacterium]|nr:alpha/beta hydrolase [Actinomycetales bacterium]
MVVTLLVAVSALAGCSFGGSGSSGASAPPSASASPAPVPPDLGAFYDQKLTWAGCGGDFQCSHLTVPVDYAEPAGATLRLAIIRLRASDQRDRIGSLVINPGGPGGSGIDYARAARAVISERVREHYDVVGFDPRGVGESDPVQCLTDAQTDTLVASDPTPDDKAEVDTTVELFKGLAAGCEKRTGALLAHVGTKDAARDMDVLRAALGDPRLFYLGKSYGTFLGAVYAQEFPKNVGRMVLDGAIDPALSGEQVDLGQAKGFEQATRAFVADCVKGRDCPLGSDLDRGMERLRQLLHRLDSSPLPTNDPSRPLTEGLGSLGIAVAMYDEGYWPTLRAALAQALGGDGSALLQLSDVYTDRGSDGRYASNQNTVIYAVNCLDRPYRGDDPVAEAERNVTTFSKAAPTWGAFLAWSELPCAYWPVKPSTTPEPIHAEGSGPIVVVGTTRDPATPYAWAQGLAKELANGHLLTYSGDGHTAYRRGSRCIDKAVDAYLLRGDVPKDGTRCS